MYETKQSQIMLEAEFEGHLNLKAQTEKNILISLKGLFKFVSLKRE